MHNFCLFSNLCIVKLDEHTFPSNWNTGIHSDLTDVKGAQRSMIFAGDNNETQVQHIREWGRGEKHRNINCTN